LSEEDRSQHVRKWLTDARLVEIEPDEFPDRIREVKQVAIGRLEELLQDDASLPEPRSVAHALGTLSRLEARLRSNPELEGPQKFTPHPIPAPPDE
jgi:hypothetical protein